MSLAFLQAHDCSEPHSDAVWGIAHTTHDTVISISADGSIKQWNSTGQPHPPNAPLPAPHTLALVSLSISSDGQYALYNSLEGLTSLLDLESGQVVGRFESYARSGDEIEPSWSISLHPSSKTYASSGASGNVTIHNATPGDSFGERLSTLATGKTKFGMKCVYSPDGRRIALSSETGQVYVFDVEANSLATTFTSHAMNVRSLAWSPDSSLLLSASEDKRLVLHDVRSSAAGGSVASFVGHTSWVLSTDISPDGRLALSGSADKSIKVWDIAARAAVSTNHESGEVWSVAWSRKGAMGPGLGHSFVSGGDDGIVRWWRSAGAS